MTMRKGAALVKDDVVQILERSGLFWFLQYPSLVDGMATRSPVLLRGPCCCWGKTVRSDRQTHGITGRVLAKHIAPHQTGARDDDVVLATVDFETGTERVEGIKSQHAALITEILGARPFQHIAQGLG